MSSPTRLSHRRRSHSASSPLPRRKPDDVKWRLSLKRSRPSSIRSPSHKDVALNQPAEKWDVEQWRRGKRARRDPDTEEFCDEVSGFGFGVSSSDPIFRAEPSEPPALGLPSTSRLPSTSAAFNFFSHRPEKKPGRHPHSGVSSARARSSREASPDRERISADEARRLRASALGELHRSVADNNEGLLRRMQDWESSRLRSPRSERLVPGSPSAVDAQTSQAPRLARRVTSYYGTPQVTEAVTEQSEDEDDMFIVGEASSLPVAPAHKKRALSMSMMEVDIPEMETCPSTFAGFDGSERSSSPVDRSSNPSAYSSDDEGHADMDTDVSSSGIFATPALSHTYSISTNSSLVSLPLSHQLGESAAPMVTASNSSNTVVPGCTTPPASPHSPSTASRSEKAIAALTLAMANGAAGINDYEALRMTEELATLDEAHAGELWS
ncbi:hypothetical protein K466DRAFT_561166 [Polyporus arcularius HHB13444]|uniref:Uncharacterized protein n=1 Tax=Polyporus arcularius HHB13444 TaxID=1314778 RepID=A0A5C3PZY5_9APHY|nr:hypothetical protein K466DRAFT_561166 [Polyporus arcularius HHB13444]